MLYPLLIFIFNIFHIQLMHTRLTDLKSTFGRIEKLEWYNDIYRKQKEALKCKTIIVYQCAIYFIDDLLIQLHIFCENLLSTLINLDKYIRFISLVLIIKTMYYPNFYSHTLRDKIHI